MSFKKGVRWLVAALVGTSLNLAPLPATFADSSHYEFIQINPVDIILSEELLRVAFCESGNRQFNFDGSILKGQVNPLDIGRFQINLKYHGAEAERLGMDLFTEEGNTNYAIYLYKTQGLTPWNWSKPCWEKLDIAIGREL